MPSLWRELRQALTASRWWTAELGAIAGVFGVLAWKLGPWLGDWTFVRTWVVFGVLGLFVVDVAVTHWLIFRLSWYRRTIRMALGQPTVPEACVNCRRLVACHSDHEAEMCIAEQLDLQAIRERGHIDRLSRALGG